MRLCLIAVFLCIAVVSAGDSSSMRFPDLDGAWISELGAEYQVSGGAMVCQSLPDRLKPRFVPWVGKTRVKDIRPAQREGHYTGKQATRDPKTGDVLYWVSCELTVEDTALTISFTDEKAGKSFTYKFEKKKQANKDLQRTPEGSRDSKLAE